MSGGMVPNEVMPKNSLGVFLLASKKPLELYSIVIPGYNFIHDNQDIYTLLDRHKPDNPKYIRHSETLRVFEDVLDLTIVEGTTPKYIYIVYGLVSITKHDSTWLSQIKWFSQNRGLEALETADSCIAYWEGKYFNHAFNHNPVHTYLVPSAKVLALLSLS